VGKSTLLRIVAGLLPATAGTVRLNTPADRSRLAVALAFQDARLLPWRRVRRNVEFGVERLAVSRRERRERAAAALDLVGLAHLADRWPHQLSGGQRQRVALARALAVQPYVLLMDEPFGALDAITRESLQDELLRVWQATGKTIVFVTHDIGEAVYLADRVVVLAGSPAGIRSTHRIEAPRPRARAHARQKLAADRIRDDLGLTAGEGI
jgi:NitT/TauT family transport system ATP-binding protein